MLFNNLSRHITGWLFAPACLLGYLTAHLHSERFCWQVFQYQCGDNFLHCESAIKCIMQAGRCVQQEEIFFKSYVHRCQNWRTLLLNAVRHQIHPRHTWSWPHTSRSRYRKPAPPWPPWAQSRAPSPRPPPRAGWCARSPRWSPGRTPASGSSPAPSGTPPGSASSGGNAGKYFVFW